MSNFHPSTLDPVGPVNTVWHGVVSPLGDFVKSYYMGFVQQQYIKFRANVANSVLPFTKLDYYSKEMRITYTRNGDQEQMDVYVSISAVLKALPSDLGYVFEVPAYDTNVMTVSMALSPSPTLAEDVFNTLYYGVVEAVDPDGTGRTLTCVDPDIILGQAEIDGVAISEEDWKWELQVTLSTTEDKITTRRIEPVTATTTEGGRGYYRTAYTITYPQYPPVVEYIGQHGPYAYYSNDPPAPVEQDFFYPDIPQEVLDQWSTIRNRSAARTSSLEVYMQAWNNSGYDVVYLPAVSYYDWVTPYTFYPYYLFLSPRYTLIERTESREIMYVYEPKQLQPLGTYDYCDVTELADYSWPGTSVNLLVTPVKNPAAAFREAYEAVYDPVTYNVSDARKAMWDEVLRTPFALVGTFDLQPPRPLEARSPGTVTYSSFSTAIFVNRTQSVNGYAFVRFDMQPFAAPSVTEVGAETDS